MKSGLFFLLVALIISACSASREIQVERVSVQLVKIDTIFRESGNLKAFTWEASNHVRYFSIEPIGAEIPLGATIGMLIRK